MSVSPLPVTAPSFFERHEFLIRRLHSLSGLVPVGAYMCVHLFTNASLAAGPGKFQTAVNLIHSFGPLLPVLEWGLIFLPILFHGAVGIWIGRSGHSNTQQYPFAANRRYTLQRLTGYLAFVFIFVHVFHLHGWFHQEWWLANVAEPLGMAQFRPYNAASTLAVALGGIVWPIFYVIGMLACCYHLANGIWSAGVRWGLWLTPIAQWRALVACGVFGVLLASVGLVAVWAARTTDVQQAIEVEDSMYRAGIESGALTDTPHKRSHADAEMMPVTQAGAANPVPRQPSNVE